MTRDDFIARNPLHEVCEQIGIKLKGGGDQRMAKCPWHDDKNPSFSVTVSRKMWFCHAGCGGGTVVELLMKHEGLTYQQFNAKYDIRREDCESFRSYKSNGNGNMPKSAFVKAEIDKIYSYQDPLGHEVYQSVRYKPKTFKQRYKVGTEWKWSLNGIQRVLYHLPEVLKSETVWVCEGEKDADSLVGLDFVATTNCGGSSAWLDAYAESLIGKHVVICGDTDEPGQKHVRRIFDSLTGKAATVKIVDLPKTVKDVSDYIATFKTHEEARKALDDLCQNAHPFIKGYRVSVYSVHECEKNYSMQTNSTSEHRLDLGKWLPSFKVLRPLVPGEFMVIIGDTGSGKTCVLSSIALSALPLPTLIFELELPSELLFERLVAARRKITCKDVETSYRNGFDLGEQALKQHFENLYVCTDSGLALHDIESQISRAELKMGVRPVLVIIDYMQLITGNSKDRYERMSDIAEQLKVMAKQLRVIIVAGSQVHRPREGQRTVSLHSAKDSGGIENSCGVLLGVERDNEDASLLYIQILKSTKDGGGKVVRCNFDGSKMLITERTNYANT